MHSYYNPAGHHVNIDSFGSVDKLYHLIVNNSKMKTDNKLWNGLSIIWEIYIPYQQVVGRALDRYMDRVTPAGLSRDRGTATHGRSG